MISTNPPSDYSVPSTVCIKYIDKKINRCQKCQPAFCFKRHKAPSVSCIISSHKAQGTQPAMTFAIASGFYDFDDLVRLATLSLASFFINISKHLNVISWPVQDDPLPGSFFSQTQRSFLPDLLFVNRSIILPLSRQDHPPPIRENKWDEVHLGRERFTWCSCLTSSVSVLTMTRSNQRKQK